MPPIGTSATPHECPKLRELSSLSDRNCGGERDDALPRKRGDRPPLPIQEILDHADELAERFENYDPADGDERSVEEYMLERAALDRARSERQVIDAVIAARTAGASWQKIGGLLGTSAQAAQQRYASVVESV